MTSRKSIAKAGNLFSQLANMIGTMRMGQAGRFVGPSATFSGKQLAAVKNNVDDLTRLYYNNLGKSTKVINGKLFNYTAPLFGKRFIKPIINTETIKKAIDRSDDYLSSIAKGISKEDLALYRKSNRDYIKAVGRAIHGNNKDLMNMPIPVTDMKSVASSLQSVKAGMNYTGVVPKSITIGGSANTFFSPPSQFETSTGKVFLRHPDPAMVVHELQHAKDFGPEGSKFLRASVPLARNAARISMAMTPISIMAGDKIKEAIPGSTDDKVIDYFKKWGPLTSLGLGAYGTFVPEVRAFNTTNKFLNTPGSLDSVYPGMQDVAKKNLLNAQRVALGTYGAISLLTPYAAGTAMQKMWKPDLEKNASALGGIQQYLNALKSTAMNTLNQGKAVVQNAPSIIGQATHHHAGPAHGLASHMNAKTMLQYGIPIALSAGLGKLLLKSRADIAKQQKIFKDDSIDLDPGNAIGNYGVELKNALKRYTAESLL